MRKIVNFLRTPVNARNPSHWVFLVFYTAMLLFVGCSIIYPSPHIDDVVFVEHVLPKHKMIVNIDNRYNNADVAQIISALEATISEWEKDFSRKTVPIVFHVIKQRSFTFDGDKIVGLHQLGKIYVVGDDNLGVSSTYHELCHANKVSAFSNDPEHKDHRWPAWDAKCIDLGNRFGRRN